MGGALRDIASLPAPLPMTAAAMGVVPRTGPAEPGRPAGDSASTATQEPAGSCAPVESALQRQVRCEREIAHHLINPITQRHIVISVRIFLAPSLTCYPAIRAPFIQHP